MSTTKGNKVDTNDAFSNTLVGAIAGIKSHIPRNQTINLKGKSTTQPQVIGDFQAFVDKNAAVDAAKTALAQAVKERNQMEKAVKAEVKQFTSWAVVMYGDAAYGMFSLPEPKQRTVSPTKTAIGIAKNKAVKKAKAAALAALAPKVETLVAFDASGNAIGGPQAGAVVTPPPAGSTSTK